MTEKVAQIWTRPSPLLASWSHALFGDFLWGFRLPPTLVMTAAVALTAEFSRVIGGGRFAQWLAGSCLSLGPIFLLRSRITGRW